MVLQLGTRRFLQAHVDTFAWQARESGQTVPDIAIGQVSDNAARARRLPVFADPAGFPVIIRWLDTGRPIDERIMVRSVVMDLAALRDWPALVALFVDHITHTVSTGDAGFAVGPEDCAFPASDVAPNCFCGLLTELLHRRWQAGRLGVTILPCELVMANGDTLRQSIVVLTTGQGRDAAFLIWLTRDCLCVNTLVDRIVSKPIYPAGGIAEPYALRAIERQSGFVMPFTRPAIVLTDDLAPFERLKLHILNLGHTWLAERGSVFGGVPTSCRKLSSNDRLAQAMAGTSTSIVRRCSTARRSRRQVALSAMRSSPRRLDNRPSLKSLASASSNSCPGNWVPASSARLAHAKMGGIEQRKRYGQFQQT